MAKLLTVQNVSKIFGSEGLRKKDVTVAVDQVTFSLADDRPTITAIAGESGSGKSTLALLLMGQIPPTTGQVLYRGKDLAEDDRRREAGVDPGSPADLPGSLRRLQSLLSRRSCVANADQALWPGPKQRRRSPLDCGGNGEGRSAPGGDLGALSPSIERRAEAALDGGAGALCRPKVVMADEPVSMVDASLRATILSSLRKLKQDFGISILYITHDLTTAYQISENILIMYAGAVVEAGSVEQVIRNPKHPYTQLLVSSIPCRTRTNGGAASRSKRP